MNAIFKWLIHKVGRSSLIIFFVDELDEGEPEGRTGNDEDEEVGGAVYRKSYLMDMSTELLKFSMVRLRQNLDKQKEEGNVANGEGSSDEKNEQFNFDITMCENLKVMSAIADQA